MPKSSFNLLVHQDDPVDSVCILSWQSRPDPWNLITPFLTAKSPSQLPCHTGLRGIEWQGKSRRILEAWTNRVSKRGKSSLEFHETSISYAYRGVTEISTCWLNTTSRCGIKKLGVSLVLFFFYFPLKVARGHILSRRGKSLAPAL